MENIPMLHYNFMSHVCHVRRTNFSLILFASRALMQGCNDMESLRVHASHTDKHQTPR